MNDENNISILLEFVAIGAIKQVIDDSRENYFPLKQLENIYIIISILLLMTNILPLTMRREYTDIFFFWKCLYGNYDVDVNDFVSFFSDGRWSTRNSLDSGFLWYHPCVIQTA